MTMHRHCDGPRCDAHQRDDSAFQVVDGYGNPPHGWITVQYGTAEYDFHSWACVRAFADEKVPVTA